jgi:hypothetical protein
MVLYMIGVNGIKCFQCAKTGPDSWCQHDEMTFINASAFVNLTQQNSTTDPRYVIKDCTAAKSTWNTCMIETEHRNGKFTFFHRGCTDGNYFTWDNQRFHTVSLSTNQTTCAGGKDGGIIHCYTMCQTDLCNGPQPVPPTPDPCEAIKGVPLDDLPEDFLFCGASSLHTNMVMMCGMHIIYRVFRNWAWSWQLKTVYYWDNALKEIELVIIYVFLN